MREDPPADRDYDLILVSVQHYHFEDAAAFLGLRVGKVTVLVFNNLWVDPTTATSRLPAVRTIVPAPGRRSWAMALKRSRLPRKP